VKIETINVEEIDKEWLLKLIQQRFKDKEENITPLKILTKLGIELHDQVNQLKYKRHRLKIKNVLNKLKLAGLLTVKEAKHGTLGVKEVAYRLVD
jgi:hypothetical protein